MSEAQVREMTQANVQLVVPEPLIAKFPPSIRTDIVTLESFLGEAMERLAAKERGEAAEIPHWTFHDLRRTAAAGMARLGIPVRVTEAVLNHVSGTGGGIVAVYQRHDYADEKRQALEAWGRFVLSLVQGQPDNVVRLEAGR